MLNACFLNIQTVLFCKTNYHWSQTGSTTCGSDIFFAVWKIASWYICHDWNTKCQVSQATRRQVSISQLDSPEFWSTKDLSVMTIIRLCQSTGLGTVGEQRLLLEWGLGVSALIMTDWITMGWWKSECQFVQGLDGHNFGETNEKWHGRDTSLSVSG